MINSKIDIDLFLKKANNYSYQMIFDILKTHLFRFFFNKKGIIRVAPRTKMKLKGTSGISNRVYFRLRTGANLDLKCLLHCLKYPMSFLFLR
jgi:hypothetical protein